jgi:hypothetical protein
MRGSITGEVMKEYKLYNAKDHTRIMVDFTKELASLTGEIVSHNDRVYEFKCKDRTFSIKDEQVDHVDVLPDEGLYQLYLVTDISHTIKGWYQGFGLEEGNSYIDVEKASYDISLIIDQLFTHAEQGLKKFYEEGTIDTPYYPLAYIVVMDILYKCFGSFMSIMVGGSPIAELMVLCWLHGYLTSSAIRKQAVKCKVSSIDVPPHEIEEEQEKQAVFMNEVMEHIRRHYEGESHDGQEGSEGTEGTES